MLEEIDQIHAEAEEAVAETGLSLSEAYHQLHDTTAIEKQRHSDDADSGQNVTLADDEASQRDFQERDRAHRGRGTVQRPQSLADAHAGAQPETVEILSDDFVLPIELSDYSFGDVVAVMDELGYTQHDLENDPSLVYVIEEKLIESGVPDDPDAEEDDDSDTAIEKAEEPAKLEEIAEVEPKPDALVVHHGEITPEQLSAHLDSSFARAEEVTHPVVRQEYIASLHDILWNMPLETPEQRVKQCEVLVRFVESAIMGMTMAAHGALTTEFIRANLPAIMEAGLPPALNEYIPGLKAAFDQAQVDNTWADTMESDEFKTLGLPKLHTPEFGEAMQECCDRNPWFLNFRPTGPSGEQLPLQEALRIKMAIGARLMAGQRITPAKLAAIASEAREAGKKSAERSTRKITANGMLGRGRTTAAMEKEETHRSLRDAYTAHNDHGAI